MNSRVLTSTALALAAGVSVSALTAGEAQAQTRQPNIIVIMGDDIGMWNIGAYHRGMMAGRTPNLDKIAKEGMLFTDYYAEASCTAGRANFITGELPIRTGMTTVGQAGAPTGLPAEAVTTATILKSMGYATGQFGKNHLGDRNEFLPTVHGFDEFFGYLYHLDAMEDPAHPDYPQNLLNVVGPRNMVHSWATNVDDPTVQPRWGKIGKQRIEDAGPLYPKRMETVDDEIRDDAVAFMDKAHAQGKPFFVWLNPTRMHIVTHLSPKYEALRNAENGWSEEEAGMAQLDDDVGIVMQKLKDMGVDDNTIVVFTTDNGTEAFTWPDGGQTPFAQSKGTVLEGGFRVPALLRWPGHVPADSVQNGIFSGLDWLPTFVSIAGDPNITDELLKGKTIDGRTYKNHLDGYDQTAAITGKGPSARHEIFYLGESTIGAVRIDDYKFRFIDQPYGWLGQKTHPDVPVHHQPAPRSVRAHRLAPGWHQGGRAAVFRLVQVRVLALRLRATGRGQGAADLHRLSAHAARRELQPGGGEGRDGQEDGRGGSRVKGDRSVNAGRGAQPPYGRQRTDGRGERPGERPSGRSSHGPPGL